jgi:DNA topoisomerase-3
LTFSLYEYICRNFLASISSDAVMENTKVTLSHGQGKFELCLRGVVIKSAGFMEVANWVRNEDKMLDKFEKGAASVLTDVQIEERWTSPPDYLKESELITLMEKHGIGTDASMATHIQNICDRNYVTVVPGKRTLVPTPLGIALVKGYLDIDKELVEPQLRSKIEKSCGQIAKGEEKFDSVVDTMVTIFKEKFKNFKANVAKMDHYLKKDFTTMEEDKQHAKTWTTCGKCKRYMDLMTESCKIVCVTCDETFSLPKRHNFQKTPGLEYCALDNYQIFYYTFEDKTKSNIYYKICPRCYDSGIDDEEGQANQACITCEVKECPHSATSNYLMECKTCNYGQLTLMATSKAQYFAVCNNYKCSQGYKVGDNIKSVKLLEFDDKLKYHKLKVLII